MNVFFRELKNFRNSTIVWVISLSAIVVLFFLLFPAFSEDIESSKKLLIKLPIALRSAFDISIQSFFTIFGFFAYLFTFVGLAGAIQAMNLGVAVVSREYTNKTVDFLLTKPVGRFKVLSNKIAAMMCLILITNVIFSFVALSSAIMVSSTNIEITTFLLISSTLLFIQLFFMLLGVTIATLFTRIKSVVAVSLPTVFTFFIIGTLGSIIGNDNVMYLSPFKFFDANYIIEHQSYELRFIVVEVLFLALMLAISYFAYIKKDIRSTS